MKSYPFSYTPKKLKLIAKKIKENFPTSENLQDNKVLNYKNNDINEILDRIREVNKDQLKFFARSLKNRDLYTLVYNIGKVEDDLLNKVMDILIFRNKKRLVEIMWRNFCNDYQNQHITYFFKKITENNILEFTDPPYIHLKDIFLNKPLRWLANHFYLSDLTFFEILNNFDIQKDSDLGLQIGLQLFKRPFKKVFQKEDTDVLYQIFSLYPVKTLIEIIENYLEVFEIYEFDPNIMDFFIDRIGKPTEETKLIWRDMKDSAYKKARQWYIEKELKHFSDNIEGDTEEARRRFAFWMEYWESIKNLKYKKEQNQLLIVFDNIAVVEFGEKNNAAYIYRRSYFDKKLAKFMSEKYVVNNSGLKSEEHIDRIFHRGYWEPNAKYKIYRLLKI